jgi:hypothetical protein
VDEPDIYAVRSATPILGNGEPWIEVAREGMVAFSTRPVLSDEANLWGGSRFVVD